MPLTAGSLTPDQDKKIRKNLRFIKDNIDARDLTDYFIEEGIFDFPDVDEINGYNPDTVANRNNCFIRLLFRSGPRAYDVFLLALGRNGQQFVADKIINTSVDSQQPSAAQNNDHGSWLQDIPERVRNRRLEERDLSRLAQSFGSGWEFVMYELGLSKPDVDHAIMENPTSVPMQIYSCLMKWKMKVASGATLQSFVNILANCDATTVDWTQIQTIGRNMQQ